MEFDLTDHLTPGPRTLRFVIENIRPKGAACAVTRMGLSWEAGRRPAWLTA